MISGNGSKAPVFNSPACVTTISGPLTCGNRAAMMRPCSSVGTIVARLRPSPMIDNDFTRSWLEGLAQETQGGPDMGNVLPVQTLEPEDIANAVFYLVSDAGRYVTGVALPVDAGYTTK